MKLSISVPDELWESARRTIGEDSPSQVVQEALRRVATTPGPPLSDLFDVAGLSDTGQSRVERIRDKLLEQAHDSWQRGYNDGRELAEEVSWDALEPFGNTANFDLARWLWNVRAPDPELSAIYLKLATYNRDDELVVDRDGDPVLRALPKPYRGGFERALTDVWQAVIETEPGLGTVSPLPQDGDIPF